MMSPLGMRYKSSSLLCQHAKDMNVLWFWKVPFAFYLSSVKAWSFPVQLSSILCTRRHSKSRHHRYNQLKCCQSRKWTQKTSDLQIAANQQSLSSELMAVRHLHHHQPPWRPTNIVNDDPKTPSIDSIHHRISYFDGLSMVNTPSSTNQLSSEFVSDSVLSINFVQSDGVKVDHCPNYEERSDLLDESLPIESTSDSIPWP